MKIKEGFKGTDTADKIKENAIVADWYDDGVRIIILRGPAAFCGYVGVPETHPAAGCDYENINVRAHGGLTFSSSGDGIIRPKGYWWYGWDYAHAFDRLYFDNIGVEMFKNGKHWTINEVIKDSLKTRKDIKAFMKEKEKVKIT